MPHNRFFTPTPLSEGCTECILSDPGEVHHLCNVMRCRTGDPVEVIDGQGFLGKGTVSEIAKKKKEPHCLITLSQVTKAASPPVGAYIAIASSRQDHFELALEKCTELGARGFFFFPSDLSERRFPSEGQKRRCHLAIRGALKQSSRLFEPCYRFLASLEEALEVAPAPLYFADLSRHAVSFDEVAERSCHRRAEATLFVGPERGWSEKERRLFEEKFPTHIISLSDATLRAETAAMIGCHELVQFLKREKGGR